MVQDKHLITIIYLIETYVCIFSLDHDIDIKDYSYLKACKKASISETGLDIHIVTIIH